MPGVGRRFLAKTIDFVAVAFTVVGFSRLTDSYLVGLLIGYGWLALSDWAGSLGKGFVRLEVRDHVTGGECSLYASAMRNLPFIASALPARLHQAILGIERKQYVQDHWVLFLIMSLSALVITIVVIMGALNNPGRRHIGDRIAGTIVVSRKKLAVAMRRPLG